jgi:hypothetical protein
MAIGEKNVDNDIERYLFAEMPDEERDAFEEKMFADDSLFVDVADAENRLVDEYAAGSLAAADVSRFERSLELVPARRQKLANARVLGEFIEENRPAVTLPERQPSFMEKVAALFTIRTPAFGMAMSAAMILLLVATGVLVVRDRRNKTDLAKLNDLQSQLDQSRQREQELQSAVNTERETSGDFVDELDRERQRREEIERQLSELKQKPPEQPETPVIASAFLLPLGGRGGSNTVPVIKIGSNTKRVALRLSLPDEIGDDERMNLDLNKRRVASGLPVRAAGGKKTLSVTLQAKELVQGKNQVNVTDDQGRGVGDYGVTVVKQ